MINPLPRTNPWFLIPAPQPEARLRLICLPHAGAGASTYFPWGAALRSHGIEVRSLQYPGRETRISEKSVPDSRALTHAIADAWSDITENGPYAVFGHSMGALLAFEVMIEQRRRSVADMPRRLFLSGRNPPHAPRRIPPISHLPDDQFLSTISTRYGSLPAQILEHPEMVQLVTPILRADFSLIDSYAWTSSQRLTIPISVFGATNDPWTTEPELREWQQHTDAPCTVRIVEGDHFFHQKSRQKVIASVVDDLSDV